MSDFADSMQAIASRSRISIKSIGCKNIGGPESGAVCMNTQAPLSRPLDLFMHEENCDRVSKINQKTLF